LFLFKEAKVSIASVVVAGNFATRIFAIAIYLNESNAYFTYWGESVKVTRDAGSKLGRAGLAVVRI
jgi:hypothetical protein